MFDGLLCKIFQKKIITLQDIINVALVTILPIGYLVFDAWYWYNDIIDNTSPDDGIIWVFINIAGIFGILLVPAILVLMFWGMYELAGYVKIAECPLNKK